MYNRCWVTSVGSKMHLPYSVSGLGWWQNHHWNAHGGNMLPYFLLSSNRCCRLKVLAIRFRSGFGMKFPVDRGHVCPLPGRRYPGRNLSSRLPGWCRNDSAECCCRWFFYHPDYLRCYGLQNGCHRASVWYLPILCPDWLLRLFPVRTGINHRFHTPRSHPVSDLHTSCPILSIRYRTW